MQIIKIIDFFVVVVVVVYYCSRKSAILKNIYLARK